MALIGILVFAPEIYAQVPAPPLAFFAALTAFLALLAVGVIRRWRWMFWLLVLAFLAGPLRVVASAFELVGLMAPSGPRWYVLLQGAIGVVQLVIGLTLLSGYRKGGVWAAF
jgi:hypothetical protein